MSDEYVPSMRSTFLYFAYGSNLLTKRIHLQNPSAIRKGIAELKVSELVAVECFQSPNKVQMTYSYYKLQKHLLLKNDTNLSESFSYTCECINLLVNSHRDIVWDFIYHLVSHQYGMEHRLQ